MTGPGLELKFRNKKTNKPEDKDEKIKEEKTINSKVKTKDILGGLVKSWKSCDLLK